MTNNRAISFFSMGKFWASSDRFELMILQRMTSPQIIFGSYRQLYTIIMQKQIQGHFIHNDMDFQPAEDFADLSLCSRHSQRRDPGGDNANGQIDYLKIQNAGNCSFHKSLHKESTKDYKLEEMSDISIIVQEGLEHARRISQKQYEISGLIQQLEQKQLVLFEQLEEVERFMKFEDLLKEEAMLRQSIATSTRIISEIQTRTVIRKGGRMYSPRRYCDEYCFSSQSRVDSLQYQINRQKLLFSQNRLKLAQLQLSYRKQKGKSKLEKASNRLLSTGRAELQSKDEHKRATSNNIFAKKNHLAARFNKDPSKLNFKYKGPRPTCSPSQKMKSPRSTNRSQALSKFSVQNEPEKARIDILRQRVALIKQSIHFSLYMNRKKTEQLTKQCKYLYGEINCLGSLIENNSQSLINGASRSKQLLNIHSSTNLKGVVERRNRKLTTQMRDRSNTNKMHRIKSSYEIEVSVFPKCRPNQVTEEPEVCVKTCYSPRESVNNLESYEHDEQVFKEYFKSTRLSLMNDSHCTIDRAG